MRLLDPTKNAERERLQRDMQSWLSRGGRVDQLPAPGSGHILDGEDRINGTYSVNGNTRRLTRAQKARFKPNPLPNGNTGKEES